MGKKKSKPKRPRKTSTPAPPPSRFNASIALALLVSLSFCITVFLTLGDYGVTWDEPDYFYAGDEYVKWLKGPSIGTIDSHWKVNSEHPPLPKLLGGLSTQVFARTLNLLNRIDSYRLSILPFVFCLNFFLFLFVSKLYGNSIALFATVSFSLLPRVFFHSHLGALDYPMATLWFLVIYSYWRGIKEDRWTFIAAVLLGLALLTKINALFLYVPIVLFWALSFGKDLSHLIPSFSKEGQRPSSKELKHLLSKLVPFFIISPIVFFLFWPWLWKDPISRIIEYANFHLDHFPIPTYYFGVAYKNPPWHLPFVLSFITVPFVIGILFIIGLFVRWEDRNSKLLVLFNVIWPLVLIAFSPNKHDGVRLFLPAFPFICILSGAGFSFLRGLLKKKRVRLSFCAGVVLLYVISVYTPLIRHHPYQYSYYNALIGGVDGAAKSGFEVEYWCVPYLKVIPWINRHAGNYLVPFCLNPFFVYQKEGMLKTNLRMGSSVSNADYMILLGRMGFMGNRLRTYFKSRKPEVAVKVSETMILGIYKLKH